MPNSDLNRVEELFYQCRSLPREERAKFLETACGEDQQTRSQIERLLATNDEAGDVDITDIVVGVMEDIRQDAKPWAGRMVGAYRIVREIGHGGMGAVYLAERADGAFKKSVAVKVLQWNMASSTLAERFRQERQILAGLDHPNIASLHDGGVTEDGLPYLVMDYIDGEPLLDWCKDKSVQERIHLFQQICSAVQYAHQHLVIHRDLKPDNILVDKSGTPKLLDFGIAKILDEQMQVSAGGNTTAYRPFTPRYSSPEQVEGQPVSTVTDVYGLGMILYEMLTGIPAQHLTSTQYEELHRVVCTVDPPKPSAAVSSPKLAEELSGDIDAIVMKALRKEPAARYGSVEQLSDDIGRYLEHSPVLARQSTFRYRAGRFIRRRRAAVIASSAALLALILFALTMTIQARRIAHERDNAARERDNAARERDNAVRAQNKADQTAKFLESLFTNAGPRATQGKEITLRETLDRGAEQAKTELASQPEVQAHMMQVFGDVYDDLGLYDQALGQLKEKLRIQQDVLHASEVDQAETKLSLADVYYGLGNVAEFGKLNEEVVASRKLLMKQNPNTLASALNCLGMFYSKERGDPAAAEPMFREAIDLYRRPDADPLNLAAALTNYGNMLTQLKRYPEAEKSLNEALDILRRTKGELYPGVPTVMGFMARLHNGMGDYAGATEWRRKELDLNIKVNGEMHPITARSMITLGGQLANYEGNIAEAEPLVRRGLEIDHKLLPKGHYDIGVAESELGNILLARGDARQAEPLLRSAVQITTATLAETSDYRIYSNEKLGICLARLKKYSEAYTYLSRACPAAIQKFGASDPKSISCQKSLDETKAALHR
ncbi:MAG: serine/threonine-protein kinase [Acidobacteriaceae bacterium]|nr:serine/threonine-protein kinase [Acidobacteriaceae bacterium]